MALRIYVVTSESGNRLIEAESKNQALAFAVKTSMTVELAGQYDLVNLSRTGIEIEKMDSEPVTE